MRSSSSSVSQPSLGGPQQLREDVEAVLLCLCALELVHGQAKVAKPDRV